MLFDLLFGKLQCFRLLLKSIVHNNFIIKILRVVIKLKFKLSLVLALSCDISIMLV